jgi:hypothetical protein
MTVVTVLALTSGQALAGPRFWTNEKKATLLRDVKSTPNENQPDAGEFVNNGNVVLKASGGIVNPTITCTELEFGGAVVSNTEGLAELAIASGLFEGCADEKGNEVHWLFDTLANGAVGSAAFGRVATITVDGAAEPFTATVHDLAWSFNDPALGASVWCTGNSNGITGTVLNSKGPFTEESEPNLTVEFHQAEMSVSGSLCWTKMTLTGKLSLETPSTRTDSAWVG